MGRPAVTGAGGACLYADERSLRFYTNRSIVRYDAAIPWLWPTLRRRVLETGYEFYALLLDHELESAQQHVPGYWTERGHLGPIGLWQVEPLEQPLPEVKYKAGFDGPERAPNGLSWRWMSEEGVVELQNTGRPMRLRIEGAVPMHAFARPSNIKVVLNGALLETVVAGAPALLREYQINASQQGDKEWSELRLIADQAMRPNDIDPRNPDRRRLSFSLNTLRWDDIPK
ncbi:MAG: hypothetical protein ABI882_12005 [Acidobacteriota bacterium]